MAWDAPTPLRRANAALGAATLVRLRRVEDGTSDHARPSGRAVGWRGPSGRARRGWVMTRGVLAAGVVGVWRGRARWSRRAVRRRRGGRRCGEGRGGDGLGCGVPADFGDVLAHHQREARLLGVEVALERGFEEPAAVAAVLAGPGGRVPGHVRGLLAVVVQPQVDAAVVAVSEEAVLHASPGEGRVAGEDGELGDGLVQQVAGAAEPRRRRRSSGRRRRRPGWRRRPSCACPTSASR